MELPKLYRTAAAGINLSPGQHANTAFSQILTGAASVIEGLGGLRNALGDAHGKNKTSPLPDVRHAALAVNMAGAMSLFLQQSFHAWKQMSSGARPVASAAGN